MRTCACEVCPLHLQRYDWYSCMAKTTVQRKMICYFFNLCYITWAFVLQDTALLPSHRASPSSRWDFFKDFL